MASEGFCRILRDKHTLPSPLREDLFVAWVRECLAKLLTTAIENNGKVTSIDPRNLELTSSSLFRPRLSDISDLLFTKERQTQFFFA